MKTADELDEMTVEAEGLIAEIEPMLHGRDPGVQGAILADLLATWLRGFHPPEAREVFRDRLYGMVDMLVDLTDTHRMDR